MLLPNQKIITIKINDKNTILDLKYQIMDIEGIHPDENLYYDEIKLDNETKICEYEFNNKSKLSFKKDINYNLDRVNPINFLSEAKIIC